MIASTNIGTIEGRLAVTGMDAFAGDINKADRTLDSFAGTAEKRFKRIKVSSEDVAKAMGLTGNAFKKFQDDALRSFTVAQAVKGLETLARNCALTKDSVEQMGRQMGLAEQSIASLVAKLNLAPAQTSSQKFFGDFYKVGQHTAVVPTADVEKSIGSFEKSIEVAFGRIPLMVNTATAAIDNALAKGANGISSGARRYAQETTRAIEDFYKVGQHTGVVQGKDVFETMFRQIGLTDEAFSKIKDTVKTSSVQLNAFQSAMSSAGMSAKRSSEIIGASLGYSKKQVESLYKEASKGIDVKVKTEALRVLRDQANLSKKAVKDLEKQLNVKLSTSSFLIGAKNIDGVLANTFLYNSAYGLVNFVQQLPGKILQVNSQLETLRKSFDGIYGDSKGKQEFGFVTGIAEKYGKELESVAASYRKYSASAQYAGQSSRETRLSFEAVVQAMTKVGGSSEDVSGALVALEQMINKGTVSSEELRQQFAERIPGAMKMAADAMGVSSAQLSKMLANGQVMATDLIPKLTRELFKFGAGWEATSDTIETNAARLGNATRDALSSDEVQQATSDILKILTNFVKSANEEMKKYGNYARGSNLVDYGFLNPVDFFVMSDKDLDDYINKFNKSTDTIEKTINVYRSKIQELKSSPLSFSMFGSDFNLYSYRINALKEALKEFEMKGYIEKIKNQLTEAQKLADKGIDPKVNGEKVIWLAQELGRLTQTDWHVFVRTSVDTAPIETAMAYVENLYAKTNKYKYSAAKEQVEKLQEIYDSTKTVMESDKDNKPSEVFASHVSEYSKEFTDKTKAALVKAKEDLQKASKEILETNLRSSDPFFGTSAGDFSSLKMKDAARLSQYKKDLVDIGYWVDIYSPDEKVREIAQDRNKALYQKYLDGVKKDKEAADKKASRGFNSTARYNEQASAALEQAQDQYEQLVAQMSGNTLGSSIAGIEKKYDRLAASIRRAMIGAKGSTAELNATLEVMGKSKAIDILLAQADAWKKSMSDAANMLGELGRLSGDPSAIYGSSMTTAQAWEADQAKRIGAIEDEAEREKQLGELRQVMALKEVEARRQAYESISTVSSKYWEAEKERIETHLEVVKKNADDENAYKIYAAQQWDEYNKALLERQAAYSGSAAQVFAAKWALAFGSYKSGATQAHEAWEKYSDSVIELSQGMISSVSGGFGAFFQDIARGTASAGDLWENMCDRMLNAFGSFIDQIINNMLTSLVSSVGGGLFSKFLGFSSGSSSPSVNTAYDMGSAITTTPFHFAKGGVFTGQPPLAVNSILDSPTYFPMSDNGFHQFANGGGVAGEAGYEAFVPLTELPNGKLGVGAQGMGSVVNVTVNNTSSSTVRVEEGKTNNGQTDIKIMIEEAVASAVTRRGSAVNTALRRGGLQQPLVIRG